MDDLFGGAYKGVAYEIRAGPQSNPVRWKFPFVKQRVRISFVLATLDTLRGSQAEFIELLKGDPLIDCEVKEANSIHQGKELDRVHPEGKEMKDHLISIMKVYNNDITARPGHQVISSDIHRLSSAPATIFRDVLWGPN